MICALLLAGLSLGVSQSSGVIGWGWNNNGQSTPPGGLTNVVAISAGSGQSVVLRANGTVTSWGYPFQPGMPAGLNDIAAIACGRGHTLALRSNGTVIAWGENESGQARVPSGLSNVVAISGGTTHSLALRSDGTVVAWGTNTYGQLNVPVGLSNVIAVSAGGNNFTAFSVALKSDGTVVVWGNGQGGQTNPPTGLSNVVAIAASPFFHTLALKSDTTVVSWGVAGLQANVPRGLTNVVGVSAGSAFSVVLRGDGSLVAWGENSNGETNVPFNARNVSAIASGWFHNVAVTRSTPPPWPHITQHPRSLRVLDGDDVQFSVTAVAGTNLTYRWQFEGRDVPGATAATLLLSNVPLSASGWYAAIVNAGGLSVRSAPAFLAVSNRPVALAQSVDTLEDMASIILLDGFDPSGLPLIGYVSTLPAAGSLYQFDEPFSATRIDHAPALIAAGDTLVYVPDPDGNGADYDQFAFIVANELGASHPAKVRINVTPVNDAPSFVKGPDIVVLEDAVVPVFAHWATNISAGAIDERAQSLVFRVDSDNNALFSSAPRVDGNGALTFRLAPDAHGVAAVTVFLEDNGGTANGGINRSGVQQFTITVRSVNDAPVARAVVFSSTRLNSTDANNFVLLAVDNLHGTFVADASASTDIEGDPRQFFWTLQGDGVPFGTGVRVTNTVAPGAYVLSLIAFDGEAMGETSLGLVVLTPGEAVEELAQRIEEASIERNRKRPLIASLKAAGASFDRGQIGSGINQLKAFEHKLRSQLDHSDATLAAVLAEGAMQIVELLQSELNETQRKQ